MSLDRLIDELTIRLRLMRVAQERDSSVERLPEKESLMLELLAHKGTMTHSEIYHDFRIVGKSLILMIITSLWRSDLVSKTTSRENQRIINVNLTQKGIDLVNKTRKERAERNRVLIQALALKEKDQKTIKGALERAINYLDEKLDIKPSEEKGSGDRVVKLTRQRE